MAQYIFDTDGSYVNFNGGGGLWRLARASNCIAWRFDETGDLFFDVYDQQYIVKAENIAEVVIDGVPLSAATDFPDAITAVFTGIGSGGAASYLVYTANALQSGTNAPTVTIFENTIGNINWQFDSTGYFIGELTGAFPTLKTHCLTGGVAGGSVDLSRATNDYVQLQTFNVAGEPANSMLIGEGLSIEIRVYP